MWCKGYDKRCVWGREDCGEKTRYGDKRGDMCDPSLFIKAEAEAENAVEVEVESAVG